MADQVLEAACWAMKAVRDGKDEDEDEQVDHVWYRMSPRQSSSPKERHVFVERCSSVVECRTRNQVSPGSNPPLLLFGRLGIFLVSIDAPVDSAV